MTSATPSPASANPTPTPARAPAASPAASWITLATVLVAAVGLATWLVSTRASLDALRTEVAALREDATATRRALNLFRYERGSEGLGANALIEQVVYWAPHLGRSSTPNVAIGSVRERLEDILDAFGALGPDAFATVDAAIAEHDQDDVRKWLLEAALRCNRDDGIALLNRVLRGLKHEPTPRLRFYAADLLLRTDKKLAGAVLKDVLLTESHRGIVRDPAPEWRVEYEAVIGTNRAQDFFNFIARFVASEHPDAEAVLLMILGRAEHDALTYKECIVHLGRMKSRKAVESIKRIYERPPGNQLNPLFQNHCLQALADILGPDARSYFEEQLRTVQHQLIATKLQDLLKQMS